MDLKSYYSVSDQILTSLNVPLVFFIFTANTFYGFCLVFNRRRLKLPLRILLGYLIMCSSLYCVSLILLFSFLQTEKSALLLEVSWMIMVYCTYNSMTCYVWLNFYYYVHIVPIKRAFLIWMKRNFKYIAFIAITGNNGIFSVGSMLFVIEKLHFGILGTTDINRTWTGNDYARLITNRTFFFAVQIDIFVCMWILVASSFSTSYYLNRHLKNLTCSGSHCTTVNFRSQMRVTIAGCLQGLLYFLFYVQYLIESFLYDSSGFLRLPVSLFITTLYLVVTTVNIGLGQAMIRQSAMRVWKALKAWCVVGMVTNDVHSRPK